jgi:hypothetical protein
MNLQIHHVINDITGVTGTAIIEAILAGHRDTTVRRFAAVTRSGAKA